MQKLAKGPFVFALIVLLTMAVITFYFIINERYPKKYQDDIELKSNLSSYSDIHHLVISNQNSVSLMLHNKNNTELYTYEYETDSITSFANIIQKSDTLFVKQPSNFDNGYHQLFMNIPATMHSISVISSTVDYTHEDEKLHNENINWYLYNANWTINSYSRATSTNINSRLNNLNIVSDSSNINFTYSVPISNLKIDMYHLSSLRIYNSLPILSTPNGHIRTTNDCRIESSVNNLKNLEIR